MLSDSSQVAGNGNLSMGIAPEKSIVAVVEFLRRNLRAFVKTKCKETNVPEESINQLLCIFLNRQAVSYPFRFHPEFIEDLKSGKSPKVDFGTMSDDSSLIVSDITYSEDDSFFSIEAKRLPTPGSNREKEYVSGHIKATGGIERFKKGIHGSRLKYAAIVGYVQKENFDHWYLTINSWIGDLVTQESDCIWSEDDKLKKQEGQSDEICVELFSENSRHMEGHAKEMIKLYHFWIDLILK